jgi:hypothetical protein
MVYVQMCTGEHHARQFLIVCSELVDAPACTACQGLHSIVRGLIPPLEAAVLLRGGWREPFDPLQSHWELW